MGSTASVAEISINAVFHDEHRHRIPSQGRGRGKIVSIVVARLLVQYMRNNLNNSTIWCTVQDEYKIVSRLWRTSTLQDDV